MTLDKRTITERAVHQQCRPLSFCIPLLASNLLLLLLFLLLLKGNETNYLGGIGTKIGLLPVLGELGLKPIPHKLVGAGLLQGTGLDHLKLGQQLIGVLEHTHVLLHVGVGQVLGGALAGVLLDGLGHHLGAGEVLAVGSPLSVFGCAKDTGLLLKSLGDLGVGSVKDDDSILFHGGILLISFIFVLRGFVFLLFSVPLCALSIAWSKRKPVL